MAFCIFILVPTTPLQTSEPTLITGNQFEPFKLTRLNYSLFLNSTSMCSVKLLYQINLKP